MMFDCVPMLDEVVHSLYPCSHKTLVFEVSFPHLLRQTMKGITYANEF